MTNLADLQFADIIGGGVPDDASVFNDRSNQYGVTKGLGLVWRLEMFLCRKAQVEYICIYVVCLYLINVIKLTREK